MPGTPAHAACLLVVCMCDRSPLNPCFIPSVDARAARPLARENCRLSRGPSFVHALIGSEQGAKTPPTSQYICSNVASTETRRQQRLRRLADPLPRPSSPRVTPECCCPCRQLRDLSCSQQVTSVAFLIKHGGKQVERGSLSDRQAGHYSNPYLPRLLEHAEVSCVRLPKLALD